MSPEDILEKGPVEIGKSGSGGLGHSMGVVSVGAAPIFIPPGSVVFDFAADAEGWL